MEPTTPNSAATEHARIFHSARSIVRSFRAHYDDSTEPRGGDATERAATENPAKSTATEHAFDGKDKDKGRGALECKYWQQGRGCFRGDECSFKHDPYLRHQNVCHRWEKGRGCRWGDTCNFIHEPHFQPLNVCHRWQRGKCTGIDCHRLHETTHSAWSPLRQRRTPSRSRSSSLPGSPVSGSDLDQPGCPRSRSPPIAKRMPKKRTPPANPSSGSQLPPTNSSSGSQQAREDTIAQLIIETFKDQGLDAASLTPEKLKETWRSLSRSLHPDKWTLAPEMARVMNKVMMWFNNEKDQYEKTLHERKGA